MRTEKLKSFLVLFFKKELLSSTFAMLAGFFVADTALAVFVPAWIAAAWLGAHLLPFMPAGVLAAFIAGGPIAALWLSVRQAARDLRQTATRSAVTPGSSGVG